MAKAEEKPKIVNVDEVKKKRQQELDAARMEIEAVCIKYNLSIVPVINIELRPNEKQ